MKLKRRDLINSAAIAGAGLLVTPGLVLGKRATDSRLRLGFIGVGLRGTWHLENSLKRNDVDVVAICDTNPERLDICRRHIADAGHRKAREFGSDDYDYRKLLAEAILLLNLLLKFGDLLLQSQVVADILDRIEQALPDIIGFDNVIVGSLFQ